MRMVSAITIIALVLLSKIILLLTAFCQCSNLTRDGRRHSWIVVPVQLF
jgi:hypothetical protein